MEEMTAAQFSKIPINELMGLMGDRQLRPWCNNDLLEAAEDEQINRLERTLMVTAGHKYCGGHGQSVLDLSYLTDERPATPHIPILPAHGTTTGKALQDGRKSSDVRKQIKEAALKKMAEYYSKTNPETSTFEKTHPIDQNMIAYASDSWSSIVMGEEVLDGEMTKILDSIQQLEEAAEAEPEEDCFKGPNYADNAEIMVLHGDERNEDENDDDINYPQPSASAEPIFSARPLSAGADSRPLGPELLKLWQYENMRASRERAVVQPRRKIGTAAWMPINKSKRERTPGISGRPPRHDRPCSAPNERPQTSSERRFVGVHNHSAWLSVMAPSDNPNPDSNRQPLATLPVVPVKSCSVDPKTMPEIGVGPETEEPKRPQTPSQRRVAVQNLVTNPPPSVVSSTSRKGHIKQPLPKKPVEKELPTAQTLGQHPSVPISPCRIVSNTTMMPFADGKSRSKPDKSKRPNPAQHKMQKYGVGHRPPSANSLRRREGLLPLPSMVVRSKALDRDTLFESQRKEIKESKRINSMDHTWSMLKEPIIHPQGIWSSHSTKAYGYDSNYFEEARSSHHGYGRRDLNPNQIANPTGA